MQSTQLIALEAPIDAICRAVHDAGGRALIVGGYVRDRLLGLASKDLDIEVYNLPLPQLEAVLGRFGEVLTVGRAFGVLRLRGIDVDFSLPRRDSKREAGHTGFAVISDPTLDFATAALRRDLTINSMGLDVLTGELLDPHHGQRDLQQRMLRATDVTHFGEDPLRGVRVAQFIARLQMTPDAALRQLCAQLDLSELSPERIYGELHKLLLKGGRPSLGLGFLLDTGLLRFFPELQALVGVPQDARWHPEGDVWVHTLMVVDQAAQLRLGDHNADAVLMFAALCHDLGKATTTVHQGERIIAHGHDVAGVSLVRRFMERLAASKDLTAKVEALTAHHLAPALFIKGGATAKAYRRLARKLGEVGLTLVDLERVARADHFGRATPEALLRHFPAGEAFLDFAQELAVAHAPPQDVVMGRHLIARGLRPGAQFARILSRCRELQDERGYTNPEQILDAVLGKKQYRG